MSKLSTYITINDLKLLWQLLDTHIDIYESNLGFEPSSIQEDYDRLKDLKEQKERLGRVIEAMAISFVSHNKEKGKI